MPVCLTQEQAECYLDGSTSDAERRIIEKHLAQCATCRRLVDSFDSHLPGQATAAEGQKTVGLDPVAPAGASETPTMPIGPGSRRSSAEADLMQSIKSMIEGYEIIEEMPRGGQAVVYKGVHLATKTNVAIKVLLPTLMASPRARYYFEREAEVIASLDHPNIVSIHDSGIIHHQYYFIMHYVDGEQLDRHAASHHMSVRERVELFKKVCSAVSYAHQQGVIHRDLKFGNILVDERGEPHILDFGLAKAIGVAEQAAEKAVVTMTGQWAGSLSTMSPEQAMGRPELIDIRSDIYSLGVILYRLLTGQYPYDVSGPTLEVLKTIQEAEPDRPRKINRELDGDIEAILLTALAKEPAQRYQSAADLMSDIEHWLDGSPIRVRCASTTYLLRKIILRHRYTSTVAALLAVIIVSFGAVSFWLYRRAETALASEKATERQWNIAARGSIALSRQLAFRSFLSTWEKQGNARASLLLPYLAQGYKEGKAARFLLDERPLAEKEPAFRKSLEANESWFAELVVGEQMLKDRDRDGAREAFERGYALVQGPIETGTLGADRSSAVRLAARLQELDEANGEPAETQQEEGKDRDGEQAPIADAQ